MAGYPVNDKLESRTDLWRISPHCLGRDTVEDDAAEEAANLRHHAA